MGTTTGAIPAPSGVTPNFDNPTDVLWTVNILTQILTMAIVTIFIAVRLFVRLRIMRIFGKDDFFVLSSWVLLMGYCVCGLSLGFHGGGYNNWEVKESEMTPFLQSAYAATLLYPPMALFTKIALLLILVRVFGPQRRVVILIHVIMGLLTVYYIAAWIIKLRICWPISYYWGGSPEGTCLNQVQVIEADSIISVISDLVILLLPLPLTWSLKMPMSKKLRVAGMLGAGGLATAFSIYRLVLIVVEGDSANGTIVFVKVVLSGNAEAGIGLICTCLPAVAILLGRRNNATYGSKRNTSGLQELSRIKPSTVLEASALRSNRFSNSHAKWQHMQSDPELGSDEATLVSYAQSTPKADTAARDDETQRGTSFDGIMKTVDVSHTVTMAR